MAVVPLMLPPPCAVAVIFTPVLQVEPGPAGSTTVAVDQFTILDVPIPTVVDGACVDLDDCLKVSAPPPVLPSDTRGLSQSKS